MIDAQSRTNPYIVGDQQRTAVPYVSPHMLRLPTNSELCYFGANPVGVLDVKKRSLLSWFGIFVAGFICGVVFSAWKLDRHGAPVSFSCLPRCVNKAAHRMFGLESLVSKRCWQ